MGTILKMNQVETNPSENKNESTTKQVAGQTVDIKYKSLEPYGGNKNSTFVVIENFDFSKTK